MRLALCHYSFHRVWEAQKWTCRQYVKQTEELGLAGIDFHARLLGDPNEAVANITEALKGSRLELASLSLSTDFNQTDNVKFQAQVDSARSWLKVAGEVGAPVSRVFGGHAGRTDATQLAADRQRIEQALELILPEAEKQRVILAVENHGGYPATGEEQCQLTAKFASPWLKAMVDVGNYLIVGQDCVAGTALAAGVAAYVHLKDYRRQPDATKQLGYACVGETLGRGVVDHADCLAVLKQAGYTGWLGLEYEGQDDEIRGVAESLAYLKKLGVA